MNREERVRILIDYLKKENTGYASLADPVDYTGRRRLLRSLMNVRWPGEADPEYTRIQDELLKEEAEQKGIVEWGQLPTIGGQFPCETIKNVDKISLWRGDITRLSVDAIVNAANSQMLGCFVPCHGCIDNAIHSAAGIQLRNECAQIMEAQGHEEPTGKAKITKGSPGETCHPYRRSDCWHAGDRKAGRRIKVVLSELYETGGKRRT